MAITVESPGIISAKEPVVQDESEIIQTAKPVRPDFVKYHNPEAIKTTNKSVGTVTFRPYKSFDEVKNDFQPQVIRPYIDSSEYLASAVATTTVNTTDTIENVNNEALQTVAVKSALDTELEEDTQYVVKFKQSTIVAATIIASIFLLLSVLCIVNIVSLVTTSAQVNALMQESSALHETLNQERVNLEHARQEAISSISETGYKVEYQPSEYINTTSATSITHSSFFDWLCHSLSRLFS